MRIRYCRGGETQETRDVRYQPKRKDVTDAVSTSNNKRKPFLSDVAQPHSAFITKKTRKSKSTHSAGTDKTPSLFLALFYSHAPIFFA